MKNAAVDRSICSFIYQFISEYQYDTDILWPRSRWANSPYLVGVYYQQPETASQGTRKPYVIQGHTQDAGGRSFGNVTVRAFLTADDSFQGECVSNAGGWYYIGVPTNGAHYLIMTKAGTTNYGGVSRNDVIPQ